MEFPHLFQPGKIGSMEVSNRLLQSALGTDFAEADGTVSPRMIEYYATRARGGFGLIVVEITAVGPAGKAIARQLGAWDDSFIEGLRGLTDAIHKEGSKIALQLHHSGRQTTKEINGGLEVVAPSAIPCPVRREMPRALTEADIHHIVEQFGDAALRAKRAGFDAVEINAAHGYLIAQFMSYYANKRIDAYGGSFENLMRFPTEVVRNIRRKVGAGFPIIFRYSANEYVESGRSMLEAVAVAQIMEEAGVDAISVSGGVYASAQHMIAPGRINPGHNMPCAETIRNAVNVPVIIAGRITSPRLAETIVVSGKADFVALGRGAVADPEFPNKALAGDQHDILSCIGCMQGCVGYLLEEHRPISCLVNPFVGEETRLALTPTRAPKRIVVVGGGVAGLAAAWIAAQRGHAVALYEKQNTLGGQFLLGAIPSAKSDLLTVIRQYIRRGELYGVQFHVGTEYDEAVHEKELPDVLILATGGTPVAPLIPGTDQPHVVQANDVLGGKVFPRGRVAIIGGGMVGCETAEFLAEHGASVSIVEMRNDIAIDTQALSRKMMVDTLRSFGVEVFVGARVKEIGNNYVRYENKLEEAGGVYGSRTGRLDDIDWVVLALGTRSYNPLEEKLRGKAGQVHILGDAKVVGKAITAIYDAAVLAASL